MNKKYFFFDIDGTLTNKNTGELVESAKHTIQLLQNNGHFVAICSGRAFYKTAPFAKEVGISNIVSNGGAAITISNQLIENRPLDFDKAVALCEEAQSLGCGILISPSDSVDVLMIDDLFINQVGYRQEPTRYFLNQNITYKDIKDIYKIYIAIDEKDEHKLTLLDSIGHIRFKPPYLTYQHDAKDEGIYKMMSYLHGDIKDVVVFGDDYNDLIMFKDEWISIAMGNAVDELKEKADFVTKNSYDDGIEFACRHFGWI
ncbi:MAG: HAD-IIB family hydrolase [Erysipelotrichaceae bacterium]|nr:HAD-IIB family hydrolase [Erysipelotrichaceae bacterium]